MDVVNVLQTPPIFFRLSIKLALSLFNSTINANYRPIPQRRLQSSYDIDAHSGFFPPRPLQPLTGPYLIWEHALVDADGNLSLGEDDSDDAVSKRAFGERWRQNIVAVSDPFKLTLVQYLIVGLV